MWSKQNDTILEYFYRNLYSKATMSSFFDVKLIEIKKRLCVHYKRLINKGLTLNEASAIIGISKREYFNIRKSL